MATHAVSPSDLKNMLHDGAELALLDVREEGQFGEGHLLFATPPMALRNAACSG